MFPRPLPGWAFGCYEVLTFFAVLRTELKEIEQLRREKGWCRVDYFKDWGVPDWLKLVGNVLAAAGVGYAQGGYVGAGVTGLTALVVLLQQPPGNKK